MRKLAEWVTAHPARGFLAGGIAGLLALLALPMVGWIPAAVVALVSLVHGPRAALVAGAGAAMPLLWGFAPAFGVEVAIAIAVLALLPAWLAAWSLASTRSLSLTFQAATLAAAVLVLAIHGLVGDPLGVMMPLLERAAPMLERTAAALAQYGIESSADEIGLATARVAWATLGWMVLLNAMLAMFAGLKAFGAMREPGLFGREFRQLRLGQVVAWLTVAALVLSVGLPMAAEISWQPVDDVLFVLAAAFLLQALAVVHGLRESQAIGVVPVVVAYLAVVLVPMVMVGLGFADTWVRFRERFGQRPGASRG